MEVSFCIRVVGLRQGVVITKTSYLDLHAKLALDRQTNTACPEQGSKQNHKPQSLHQPKKEKTTTSDICVEGLTCSSWTTSSAT